MVIEESEQNENTEGRSIIDKSRFIGSDHLLFTCIFRSEIPAFPYTVRCCNSIVCHDCIKDLMPQFKRDILSDQNIISEQNIQGNLVCQGCNSDFNLADWCTFDGHPVILNGNLLNQFMALSWNALISAAARYWPWKITKVTKSISVLKLKVSLLKHLLKDAEGEKKKWEEGMRNGNE